VPTLSNSSVFHAITTIQTHKMYKITDVPMKYICTPFYICPSNYHAIPPTSLRRILPFLIQPRLFSHSYRANKICSHINTKLMWMWMWEAMNLHNMANKSTEPPAFYYQEYHVETISWKVTKGQRCALQNNRRVGCGHINERWDWSGSLKQLPSLHLQNTRHA
jgi:hypothetical protein